MISNQCLHQAHLHFLPLNSNYVGCNTRSPHSYSTQNDLCCFCCMCSWNCYSAYPKNNHIKFYSKGLLLHRGHYLVDTQALIAYPVHFYSIHIDMDPLKKMTRHLVAPTWVVDTVRVKSPNKRQFGVKILPLLER